MQHVDEVRAQIRERARALGRPLEVALVVGTTPNLGYVSTARVPSDMEEYAVAGGMAGQPVELVKCVSVDLEVPAHAEVVIEGVIPTDDLEIEGAFGESDWLARLASDRGGPYLFIAEAVLVYLQEEAVRRGISAIAAAFPGSQFVFDTVTPAAIAAQQRPMMRTYRAPFVWGCADPRSIEGWARTAASTRRRCSTCPPTCAAASRCATASRCRTCACATCSG